MMRSASFFALALGLSTANAALPYRGVDWSSVSVEERAGVLYKDIDGKRQPLETILGANGINAVRQRIWVDPRDGVYNLAYNIDLARRAKDAGLQIYLNLHYSDTWADPGHQQIPAGWPTEIEGLSNTLYNYTKEVADKFESSGLQPEIISIGNEIRSGLLWPTGKTPDYGNIARLLQSAARGVKDSKLDPKPKIMIHLDNGWDWSAQKGFYTSVLSQKTLTESDFDMMGVSFYPFYNSRATLANLKSSLANMADTWGKEIAVVELDWPTSCPNSRYEFPADVKDIPLSAEGQATFIQRVAEVVASVKNGTGVFYWEPAWIHNANLGSSCADNCMFAASGQALSSLSVFSKI